MIEKKITPLSRQSYSWIQYITKIIKIIARTPWSQIPRAEKTLLCEIIDCICVMLSATIILCFIPLIDLKHVNTINFILTMVVFGRYFLMHKPDRNAALDAYFAKVSPQGLREYPFDIEKLKHFMETSDIVERIGGRDAIDNAVRFQ